ncbi:hypothetical protein FA95DRAFT_1559561 [Auriscalpium vulgare]|uniref:Uncharacterized protein n=1 Tax=Auriscalpium vulgare TaxID=40419 RepID=A0ACB8RTZ7_9AGAM|nr:hypothetical protein FA95DRAFT_1559561 [Auriscalpium vulgare]
MVHHIAYDTNVQLSVLSVQSQVIWACRQTLARRSAWAYYHLATSCSSTMCNHRDSTVPRVQTRLREHSATRRAEFLDMGWMERGGGQVRDMRRALHASYVGV